MKLQFIRHGKRRLGIALIFNRKLNMVEARVLPDPPSPAPPEFQRICDTCTVSEGIVWCRTHSVFLCRFCLSLHNSRCQEICDYLPMRDARELILQRLKNEAHT